MKKIILTVFLSIIFLPTTRTNAQAFLPPLTLISPNGGEIFKPGQIIEVVFKSNLPLGTEVSFALNREDGWYKEIGDRYRINKILDLYTKKITIPSDTPLNKYMVAIEDSNRKYSDLSDSNFEIKRNIKSSIKLNSQKQNKKYLRESSILLSWKTENIKAVDIYLVKGNKKYLLLENYSEGNEFSYAVGRVDDNWGIDKLKNGSYSIAICQTGNPIDKKCAKFKFKIYGKSTEISSNEDENNTADIVEDINKTDANGTPLPSIRKVSPSVVKIGDPVELYGDNLAGFESDLNLWIENSKGEKAIVYGQIPGSNKGLIYFVLEEKHCTTDTSYIGKACPKFMNINPEAYKVYVSPYGNKSNVLSLTVKD